MKILNRRLDALEQKARVLLAFTRRARVVADPRCMPDQLEGKSWEDLRALSVELGITAPPGTQPAPGQLPYDLDQLSPDQLVKLYFRLGGTA